MRLYKSVVMKERERAAECSGGSKAETGAQLPCLQYVL